jgi:hypothetical protein
LALLSVAFQRSEVLYNVAAARSDLEYFGLEDNSKSFYYIVLSENPKTPTATTAKLLSGKKRSPRRGKPRRLT